jgi:ArsR family metal-binding transcriptional regulator
MDVDMMMDIDMDSGNHACTSCGKQVCHSCAVSNLGAERKCLNCAGRKKTRVGGIGWMDQD